MSTVHPYGGLCNRLRVILSALAESDGNIWVIWDKSEEICAAHFLDVFEPIPKVTFINKGKGLRTCHALNAKWQHKSAALLRPLPEIKEKIKNVQQSLGTDYIALHVRRTDFSDRLDSQSYEMYYSLIDKSPQTINIYLATDNNDTLNTFEQKYPGRIYNSSLFNHKLKRQTSLRDAVIDMFICADATIFQGTKGSSFSEMIISLSS